MSTRVPIARQISWVAALPAFAIATILPLVGLLIAPPHGILLGMGTCLLYLFGSRELISRDHRRGVRLVRRGQFADAIPDFEKSVEFFDRNPWIDRFRSVVLLSASAISYREMAINNMAFCYSQIGDGKKARELYEESLRRFPANGIATAGLKMLDAGASTK